MLLFFLTSFPATLLGITALLCAGAASCRLRRRKVASVHLRGRSLRCAKEVETDLTRQLAAGDPGLQFGHQVLPSSAAYSHIAVVGATGSGKTILQRLLMQSTLRLIGRGLGHRALVYDAKQDMLPILAGMKLRCPIYTLNSLDARSVAWDMAADVTCPASALQVASILIPDVKADSNPFFAKAARHLLYGAILALLGRGKPWTFRELILHTRDARRLQRLLAESPHTEFLLQYFEHLTTSQNILSMLLAYLCPFEVIAAAWDRARESVSLKRWIRDESVLVLGNDEPNRTAVDAMNRLIFRRLTELVLGQAEIKNHESRRTWFFLDEVREAGRLDGLSRLLTKGRSKGAAVVLGFQDIAGLYEVYGKEVAEELVGQCSTKAILRLNSPETAAWASRLIGSHEVIESRRGYSKSYKESLTATCSRGESISHGVATRPLVLESEFFDLPETNPTNGLTGFFVTASTGAYKDHLPGSWIGAQLKPSDYSTANFEPRPVQHQYLRPWSDAETKDPLEKLQLVKPQVDEQATGTW